MPNQNSVSIADLTKKVRDAVDAVRKDHAHLTTGTLEVSFVPQPGIIGFVIQEEAIGGRSFAEVSKLATQIGQKVGPLAGPANILLRDKHIIVGFFPAKDMLKLG